MIRASHVIEDYIAIIYKAQHDISHCCLITVQKRACTEKMWNSETSRQQIQKQYK